MAKPKHQRLPLTPASSAEIAAMDKKGAAGAAEGGSGGGGGEVYFSLPPAAISTGGATAPVSYNHHGGHHLPSPTSPQAQSRLQSSTTQGKSRTATAATRQRSTATKRPAAPDFDLPPPPTRTRKIIQMKPKTQEQEQERSSAKAGKNGSHSGTTLLRSSPPPSTAPSTATATSTPAKRKQAGATTAAGRKIARKTAHSLIERRRRSKMNEEFGTLKDMIPACKGHDMHKLAILQASIEYMNYLEQCIKDLKTANRTRDDWTPPPAHEWTGAAEDGEEDKEEEEEEEEEEEKEDGEPPPMNMYNSPRPTPLQHGMSPKDPYHHRRTPQEPFFSRPPASDILPVTLPSPAIGPSSGPPFSSGALLERTTMSQTTPSFSHSAYSSTTTSPVIPSQPQGNSVSVLSRSSSSSYGPNADVDHEASTALLMLNKDIRRETGPAPLPARKPPERKFGISVNDLISHY